MQLIIAQICSKKKFNLVVAYTKLNFTYISVSKPEFKHNLIFHDIHMQHDNQKPEALEDDILDLSRSI